MLRRFYFEKTLVLAALLMSLSACSDDSTSGAEENALSATEIVESAKKLPKCSDANEGEQAFVKGESSLRLCVDGKWVSVYGEDEDTVYVNEGVKNVYVTEKVECETRMLPDSSGIKILCNGDSIGVVLNGEQGAKGDKGDDGVQGDKGDKGDAGAQGEPGEKGDKGDKGAQGELGEKGDKGDVGAQGEPGEKGDKGDEGAQGEPGRKGDKGDDGPAGAAGKSCSVAALADSSGYKIICGGDSVGVILHGKNRETDWSVYDPVRNILVDYRDEHVYKTTTIGDQVWMAENLNYRYYLQVGSRSGDTSSFCFRNNLDTCAKYGRFYQWSAAIDSAGIVDANGAAKGCGYMKGCAARGVVRGVCPKGWHVPSVDEFGTLFKSVGGAETAGIMLKSKYDWKESSENVKGLDSFGFSGLPTGYISAQDLKAYNRDIGSYFWTSSIVSERIAGDMYLYYTTPRGVTAGFDMFHAYSIRCVKD